MNVNIQNFAQEKKNTLIELIGDPDMREKLNQKQISAEELLVIPEFMEMYISAKSHALIDGPDTEDKMDYLHIERLATVVKDTANSQAEVIAA